MKKNITINLYGTLYAIDEDACQLLEQYTENMRCYFTKQEGGADIIDDIEHRIAELLWENKEEGHEAVDIETIKSIIEKIGNPEQMSESSENTQKEAESGDGNTSNAQTLGNETYNKEEKSGASTSRKFFRNGNDKMLGGVLSGTSQYFGGKDPLPWRIGFIIISFVCFFTFQPYRPFNNIYGMMNHMMPMDAPMMGNMFSMMNDTTSTIFSPLNFFINILRYLPIILYIAFWAFAPEAKTVEDRLKMQGKPVDSNNIKQETLIEHEQQQQPTEKKGCANGCLSIFVICAKILGIGCGGCLIGTIILAVGIGLFGWGATSILTHSGDMIGNIVSNYEGNCGAPSIERDFDVKEFKNIEFDCVGTVHFSQSDKYSLHTAGDSCLHEAIKVECKDNGTLTLKEVIKDNKSHGAIHYYITAPSIESIKAKGVGSLLLEGDIRQMSDLEIELEGVGSVDADYIECHSLVLRNEGVGNIEAQIKTHDVTVYCTGVGNISLSGETDFYNECEKTQFISDIDDANLIIKQK